MPDMNEDRTITWLDCSTNDVREVSVTPEQRKMLGFIQNRVMATMRWRGISEEEIQELVDAGLLYRIKMPSQSFYTDPTMINMHEEVRDRIERAETIARQFHRDDQRLKELRNLWGRYGLPGTLKRGVVQTEPVRHPRPDSHEDEQGGLAALKITLTGSEAEEFIEFLRSRVGVDYA
jgi:hypothetical protein